MTLTLRHPSAEEFREWSVAALEEYIDEIAASGAMSRERADVKARRDHEEALPDGLDTPGQHIFRVEADGLPVGWLWMATQGLHGEVGEGFIYDIEIDEAFRGRGYGRATMLLAEEEARRLGLRSLQLGVFGNNTTARRLYLSLGYRETSVQMRKRL